MQSQRRVSNQTIECPDDEDDSRRAAPTRQSSGATTLAVTPQGSPLAQALVATAPVPRHFTVNIPLAADRAPACGERSHIFSSLVPVRPTLGRRAIATVRSLVSVRLTTEKP